VNAEVIDEKKSTMLMETWLSRAGMRPLSLSLTGSLGCSGSILDAFRGYAVRWQHVSLSLPYWKDFIVPAHHLPLLETFELHSLYPTSEMQTQQLSVALLSAPRLQGVVWHSPGTQGSHIELPWAQLTSIILTVSLSVTHCLDILRQSQRLECFCFKGNFLPPELPYSQSPIILPRLLSFTIPTGEPLDFLDNLTCPALREIEFCDRETWDSHWSMPSLVSLLVRSRCALERLHIRFSPISEIELIECLQHTNSSLIELTVQTAGNAVVTDNFFTSLTNRHYDSTRPAHLCPKLEVLALYGCISASQGTFAKMIESRLKMLGDSNFPATLTPIQVVETFDDHTDVMRLKELRNEGLTLKLYSHETGDFLAE
jgi:hypothetical protein